MLALALHSPATAGGLHWQVSPWRPAGRQWRQTLCDRSQSSGLCGPSCAARHMRHDMAGWMRQALAEEAQELSGRGARFSRDRAPKGALGRGVSMAQRRKCTGATRSQTAALPGEGCQMLSVPAAAPALRQGAFLPNLLCTSN